MRRIPAEGFTLANGRRRPNEAWGSHVQVQIRGDGITAGWVDPVPWPVAAESGPKTRWIWDRDADGNVIEHPGDIVAIREVE